jgi:heme/copper-type cytochrome/quinol oxidase subunit 2
MTVIDLLILIIVVTILVTIALGVMTYIAYKLRLARRPTPEDDELAETHYFVLHKPPTQPASSDQSDVA